MLRVVCGKHGLKRRWLVYSIPHVWKRKTCCKCNVHISREASDDFRKKTCTNSWETWASIRTIWRKWTKKETKRCKHILRMLKKGSEERWLEHGGTDKQGDEVKDIGEIWWTRCTCKVHTVLRKEKNNTQKEQGTLTLDELINEYWVHKLLDTLHLHNTIWNVFIRYDPIIIPLPIPRWGWGLSFYTLHQTINWTGWQKWL